MTEELSLSPVGGIMCTSSVVYPPEWDRGWPWPLSSVQSWFEKLWNTILGIAQAAASTIYSWLRPLFDKIFSFIGDMASSIHGWFRSILDSVVSAIGTGITTIKDVFVNTIFGTLGEIFTSFVNWLETLWTRVVNFFRDTLVESILKALSWFWERLSQAGRAAWDFIQEILRRFAPVTPEKALMVAAPMFGFATTAGIAAHALTLAPQILPFLRAVPLQYLSGFLGELSGWGRISAATLGVMITIGVATPYRYFMNRQLRPILPSEKDLMEMASRGIISPGKWKDTAAYYGYPDEWLTSMVELRHTPLSAFLVRDFCEKGLITPAVARAEASRRGYHPDIVNAFGAFADLAAAGEARPIMTGAAIKLYREGFITMTQLRTTLLSLGVREPALSKFLIAAQLDFIADQWVDTVAVLREAVRRGVMTPSEMEDELLTRGMLPERAKLLAERERIRLLGKPKK